MNQNLIPRIFLIAGCSALVLVAAWNGIRIHALSRQRAEIKKDYSVLNNITYGLLSVNAWRDHLVDVVTHRIDDFEFTPEQEAIVKSEVEHVLHAVIHKADSLIALKQKSVGGKLKKFAVRTFVSSDKLHERVPIFAETIVDELKKPANKEKLKVLARQRLENFGSVTYDSTADFQRMKDILSKYDRADVEAFDKDSDAMLAQLQDKTYLHTYFLLGIMAAFVMIWWLIIHRRHLYGPMLIMSILLAIVVLAAAITSPMIEIDARIKQMTFLLMGESISFHDQVIFFQSKSIVDVVVVLLETRKFDSMLVGLLILIFSIMFPVGKLVSTGIVTLGSESLRNNSIIRFFAFKSAKWSMADVNVVAIFMAYIGFKGILDSQLGGLNMKTESMASISTNQTSLQPGFILFVSFVLFSLMLSVVLQRLTTLWTHKQAQKDVRAIAPALMASG